MPRSLRFCAERVRAVPGAVLWPTGLALGVVAESRAYGWSDVHFWLPDLVVGLVFVWVGARIAGERAAGFGVLCFVVGVAWFVGTLAPGAALWHRGPLIHVLAAYPGWRTTSRLMLGMTIVGYVAAVSGAWRSDELSIVLAVGLIVASVWVLRRLPARSRAARWTALCAAVVFGSTVAISAGVRLAVPSGAAAEPALLAYEVMLCAVAVGLAARVPEPAAVALADLVVELSDSPSGTVRDALAEVLGDPALEVGIWSDGEAFTDDEGRKLSLPPSGPGRVATYVEQAGEPIAVIVHDEAALREPSVAVAIAAAARLSAVNASLGTEVRRQVDELVASRRRLVAASDEERDRLEHALRAGAERRLSAMAVLLEAAAPGDGGAAAGRAVRARRLVAETIEDLHVLARGLHPRELDGGLEPALRLLAGRCPIPVRLRVEAQPLAVEVARAIYFVCAESLANATKHAAASLVTMEVVSEADGVCVRVSDDGAGGADPALGSGLRGLADRIEALGGTSRIDGSPGGGTSVAARLPC